MRHLLLTLFAGLCLAITPAVATGDEVEGILPDGVEIPPDIVELATDPLASPGGALPDPVLQRRLARTRSAWFFILPAIGFWLILRRRGNRFRI
jgi:hypothetical protein